MSSIKALSMALQQMGVCVLTVYSPTITPLTVIKPIECVAFVWTIMLEIGILNI